MLKLCFWCLLAQIQKYISPDSLDPVGISEHKLDTPKSYLRFVRALSKSKNPES